MGKIAVEILNNRGIIGVDEKNKIILAVGDVPFTIEGYKVIRLKEVPRAFVDRKKRFRPLISGVSIGNVDITAGTLGWFVEYQNETHILSNAHVFHPEPWSEKPPKRKTIIQPGRYDGGDIADEVAYYVKHVPIKLALSSTCPVARAWIAIYNGFARLWGAKTRLFAMSYESNKVDASIAYPTSEYLRLVLLDNGNRIVPEKVVGLLFAGSEADNIFIATKARNIERELGVTFSEEIADVEVGDIVSKCGRTTGCSRGDVISDSMKIKVFYGAGFAVFEDVIIVNAKSAGGDSGSLVYI